MKTHKIKGTLASPAVKILALEESKIIKENGLVFIEGYANTKNTADRYGDVPTPLTLKRDYVYELTEFRKNPVLLIDHVNRLDHLAGSITEIREDEKGLYFKALFSASNHPTVAHARQIYQEGHAKGISIAGRFHYEDSARPERLTLAEIYEISLVAIPADPNSLAQISLATAASSNADNNQEATEAAAVKQNPQIKREIENWIAELSK
ncbi:MAG: HK97 family phage prohead protease [Elusimicrobiota bacterium]|jgi:HK97 family phage prohead protease|nr:HK97 family phage prohead protease [Elusimicrobiota bacterium]